MQIADLRVLLRLPTSRLPAGCNFTAAAMLFNLIAGASVCFYGASHRTMSKRPPAGKHFQGILIDYFPWIGAPVAASTGARVLWTYSRNPLAHNLGLDRSNAPEILVSKRRIGPRRIAALEDEPVLPVWCAPVLAPSQDGFELSVPGLYWGTHKMLRAVLSDPNQRRGAEQLASTLGF